MTVKNPDLTPQGDLPPKTTAPSLSRSEVIDAVARVVARQGPGALRWAAIVKESGSPSVSQAWEWYPDLQALLDECYSRTAQGLEESLLVGETAPGTALEKLAAFLVAALDIRRERGSFLSFRVGDDLPERQRRRLRERELMLLTRLKRILMKGQHDGSLALRHVDSACAMIFACLEVPATAGEGPEQRMWDGELIELLLAALAEPHAPESVLRREIEVAQGSCRCGAVSYEIDGPFDVMSDCHCSICRMQQGTAFATYVSVPMGRLRWIAGQEQVTHYAAPSGQPAEQRSFCRHCGSPTPSLDGVGGTAYCPAENLQRDLGIRPQSHVFVRP
ncbi:MAG TPA: GFA family protein [Steroidobacteraceae bacterium]|nr:GFA family protein [Steroidobacteraceae bacterium]